MTDQNADTPSQKLYSALVPRRLLQADEVERMYALMRENYEGVSEATFRNDLSRKQLVLVLRDGQEVIQGFTTWAIDPAGCGGRGTHIIFSGDTLISPAYWGTQEMMRGWCRALGRLLAGQPEADWYWYLISKGHRTYMYLPLFLKEYYPSATGTPPARLKNILDDCSRRMFGNCWYPEEGLIRFPEPRGALKPELAQATFAKKHKPDVRFFLEKNPEFYKGNELACLASLAPDNINARCLPLVREGMSDPLFIHEL